MIGGITIIAHGVYQRSVRYLFPLKGRHFLFITLDKNFDAMVQEIKFGVEA
jgi:hypothetical protein